MMTRQQRRASERSTGKAIESAGKLTAAGAELLKASQPLAPQAAIKLDAARVGVSESRPTSSLVAILAHPGNPSLFPALAGPEAHVAERTDSSVTPIIERWFSPRVRYQLTHEFPAGHIPTIILGRSLLMLQCGCCDLPIAVPDPADPIELIGPRTVPSQFWHAILLAVDHIIAILGAVRQAGHDPAGAVITVGLRDTPTGIEAMVEAVPRMAWALQAVHPNFAPACEPPPEGGVWMAVLSQDIVPALMVLKIPELKIETPPADAAGVQS